MTNFTSDPPSQSQGISKLLSLSIVRKIDFTHIPPNLQKRFAEPLLFNTYALDDLPRQDFVADFTNDRKIFDYYLFFGYRSLRE